MSVITGKQSTGLEGMTTDKNSLKSVATVLGKPEKTTLISLKDEERTKCSIWSRVMGYHRPTNHYNIGKKQEFADRVTFKEPKEI